MKAASDFRGAGVLPPPPADTTAAAPGRVVATGMRHLPDRWLHRLRRRLLLRRLARRGGASSVLFVCVGNIYRSPYAAAVFLASLPEPIRKSIRCQSAGVMAADRPVPPDAVGVAGRRGIDLTAHRSQTMSGQLVGRSELIVVMDASLRRLVCQRFRRSRRDVILLGDLDPEPIQSREIADPWGAGPEVLEGSYARLARCARELANALMGIRGGY